MRPRDRWLMIMLAVAGLGVCIAALIGFFTTMVSNGLPWDPQQTARDHYLAVGQSYSQGFSVGFFLCFFLSMVATAVSSWRRQRVRERAVRSRRGPGLGQVSESSPAI